MEGGSEMTDEEINEIPPERVLDREYVLRAKLKEALQDRDEARRERDELRKNYLALVEEWKKSVFRLARERDEARREWKEAWEGWNKALDERNEVRRDLSRVRKELVSANRGAERNAHINNSLCSKLIQAERERGDALKGEV
jgi:predicted RNase H-like HicB family nuclease